MAAIDTVGSGCLKEQLKDDDEYECACKKCEKEEE